MHESDRIADSPTFGRVLRRMGEVLNQGAGAYAWIVVAAPVFLLLYVLLIDNLGFFLPAFYWMRHEWPVDFGWFWWRSAVDVTTCLMTFRLLAGKRLPLLLEALLFGVGAMKVWVWQAVFGVGDYLGGPWIVAVPLLATAFGGSLAMCTAVFEDPADVVGVVGSWDLSEGNRPLLLGVVGLFGVLPSIGFYLLEGRAPGAILYFAGILQHFFLCIGLTVAYVEIRRARGTFEEDDDFYNEYFSDHRAPDRGDLILDSDWDELWDRLRRPYF